jgi:hypothetical protein
MLEEIAYVVLFALIFCGVHIQFKYCIPVGVFILKIIETSFILFFIKVYMFIRINGNSLDTIITKESLINLYGNITSFVNKLEL